MITMLRDLFRHQAFADAAMLETIRNHPAASAEGELRVLLHHILVAHRFWTRTSQGLSFDRVEESKVPATWDELAARFRETQEAEVQWLDGLTEADLARVLDVPLLPGRTFTVGEGLMQVC